MCVASAAEARGRLGFTVIIYYQRRAEVLGSRRDRLPRLRSDRAAMSPYGKGKGSGRGRQPGLATGVRCLARGPCSARPPAMLQPPFAEGLRRGGGGDAADREQLPDVSALPVCGLRWAQG